ncbi:hypothetical protein [Polynucleobacter aenigmaticus]|uniref:hypothetical protein n=1 Tax=Polynucleobacter aenigmaticus TaxID=1743164 RepID=UPI00137476BB|nr:hypothetical protein [Polynucleobacter aenigmaticus]
MNLASIFRAHDAKLEPDHSNLNERLFEPKSIKVESRADAFLVDKKYALQLDELI